jgi:hypothetical protein
MDHLDIIITVVCSALANLVVFAYFLGSAKMRMDTHSRELKELKTATDVRQSKLEDRTLEMEKEIARITGSNEAQLGLLQALLQRRREGD